MGVKVREKRGKLYLDTYYQGRRTWESLGLTLGNDPYSNKEALRLADIICKKREFQLVSGEWNLLDSVAAKQTLVQYAELQAAKFDPKHHLPKSLKYLKPYAKEIKIGNVNESFLEGYQAYLFDNGLAKCTASHYFAALSTVLRRAVRDRIIQYNPAERIKGIKIPETIKISLTQEELQRLADTPIGGNLGAEIRRALLFAAFTGLRVSDLKSLKWSDIHLSPLQLHKRQAKTGTIVIMDLHPTAWRIINDGDDHAAIDPVFPLLSTTNANTNQYLKKWAKDAGLEKSIGWHTARHSFAVLTLEGGADFYTVSKLMGHTKPMTTAVYAKATDKMKKQAIEGLPKLEMGNDN